MALLKQSTAYTRTFKMISSTDHFSLITGSAPVVNISKAGAAFAAAAGAVSETSAGWYRVALTAADSNTLGDLSFYITGTGADDTDFVDQVIALDFAVANVPANVTQLLGTAWLAPGVAGTPDVNAKLWGGTAITASSIPVATAAGAAGGLVVIGTTANTFKSDASANVTFANTSIATVTTVTNQLTAQAIATGVWTDTTAGDFTAALSVGKSVMNGVALGTGLTVVTVSGAVGSVTGLTASNLDATISSRASQTSLDTLDDYVDTEVAAIKAKTDQFVFTVANQVDANSLAVSATGIRTAVGLAAANLDSQIVVLRNTIIVRP